MCKTAFVIVWIFLPLVSWAGMCLPAKGPSCFDSSLNNLIAISNLNQKLRPSQSVNMTLSAPADDRIRSESVHVTLSENQMAQPTVINLNPSKEFQKIWGFGGAITDSCLANYNRLSPQQKKEFMEKVFAPTSGAGFSILRMPIGSNDFSLSNYTLDESPGNKPDPELKHFNASKMEGLIQFANEAKKYNPDLQVMITPWSPPAWMKTSKHLAGGELDKKYYGAYADYLIKTVQTLQSKGISVKQMSIMNEPFIPDAKKNWYYTQGYMSQKDQQQFLNQYLIPRLQKMSSPPQVLIHDHNWNIADLTLDPIANKKQSPLIGGVAYHCYGGDLSSMEEAIQKQNRGLASINTECSSTRKDDNNSGTFQWWMETQSVDAIRAGTSGAIGWNLCLDEKGGPHIGGSDDMRGMITITSGSNPKIEMNAEFKALAQTSKYVQSGAVRIDSSDPNVNGLSNVAFRNPDGSKVLVIRNDSDKSQMIDAQIEGCSMGVTSVPAGGAVTLRWP